MKKKQRFLQACEMGGSIYGKRRTSKKGMSPVKRVDKGELVDTYNKFFKNQAEALYRAINRSK